MDKEKINEYKSSNEAVESARLMFMNHIGLLAITRDLILQDIFAKKTQERIHKLYGLFESIISAGLAITALVKLNLINESLIIARAFIERSINFTYLMLCDEKEYKNYFDYAAQKGYRTAIAENKLKELLGLRETIAKPNEALKAKLTKFTSKKGTAINKWTQLTLKERMEFIANNYGEEILSDYIQGLFERIYEDASEAVHGTLYGASIDIGVYWGKSCPVDVNRHQKGFVLLTLVNFSTLVKEIIKLLNDKTPYDLTGLLEKAKTFWQETSEKIEQLRS